MTTPRQHPGEAMRTRKQRHIIVPLTIRGTTAIVFLNCGVAYIDASDWSKVSVGRWSVTKCRNTSYATRQIRRDGRLYTLRMHRLLRGEPRGMDVDHIDGDGLNNRQSNLRVCTHQQNTWNRHSRNSNTGLRGVHRLPCGKFSAHIREGGRLRYLGRFTTAKAAALEFDIHARRVYGEFASLNYPLEACHA